MLSIKEKEEILLKDDISIVKVDNGWYYTSSFKINDQLIEVTEEDRDSVIFLTYAIKYEGLKTSKRERLSETDFFSMAGHFVKEQVSENITEKYLDLCSKHNFNFNEKLLFEKFLGDQFKMLFYIARLKKS